MSITKCFLQNHVLISVLLVIALRPIAIEAASESDRLERLERAVEQLQKRNAELEAEVRSLKKQTVSVPEGKMKTKVTHDSKSYVEKEVVEEEKAPLYVFQRGLELKLVLGGYIQATSKAAMCPRSRAGLVRLRSMIVSGCAGRGSI